MRLGAALQLQVLDWQCISTLYKQSYRYVTSRHHTLLKFATVPLCFFIEER